MVPLCHACNCHKNTYARTEYADQHPRDINYTWSSQWVGFNNFSPVSSQKLSYIYMSRPFCLRRPELYFLSLDLLYFSSLSASNTDGHFLFKNTLTGGGKLGISTRRNHFHMWRSINQDMQQGGFPHKKLNLYSRFIFGSEISAYVRISLAWPSGFRGGFWHAYKVSLT